MLKRMAVLAVLGVLAVAPMVRSAPPILDSSDSDEVEEAMASGEESGCRQSTRLYKAYLHAYCE